MGVAATNNTDITIKPVSNSGKNLVEFSQLHLGDRFQLEGHTGAKYPIFTKIRHDLARAHSHESRALGRKGFGYMDDQLVSVDHAQKVKFIPFE